MPTTNQIKTQDLLDAIHIKYEQATDTPLLTDDDGKIRMSLLNEGINHWETEEDTRWKELIVLNAQGSTIAAGKVVYDLSTFDDFREMASRVRLLRADGSYAYASVVTPETFQQYMNGNGQVISKLGGLVVCISGNGALGYQMHLGWVPSVSDGTIGAIPYFDYYKWANRLVTVNDVPEMSNPYYLIDYVTGELFVNDDVNLYSKFSSDAEGKLDDMQTNNEAQPPYASSAVEDQNYTFAMG